GAIQLQRPSGGAEASAGAGGRGQESEAPTVKPMPFEVAFSPALALGILGEIEVGLPVSPHERAYAIAWIEDELARLGFGVVTAETSRIGKRVDAGLSVSLLHLVEATYDFWSGPVSEYFSPPPIEEMELA